MFILQRIYSQIRILFLSSKLTPLQKDSNKKGKFFMTFLYRKGEHVTAQGA